MRSAALTLLTLLVGCGTDHRTGQDHGTLLPLEPVFIAQNNRDPSTLCALLGHPQEEVRARTALAFASLGHVHKVDRHSCLLKALDDPMPSVRSAAAFSLGFLADTLVAELMAERALAERDTSVQRSYLGAAAMAMARSNRLTPQAILHMLERGTVQDKIRMADALRRNKDLIHVEMVPEFLALLDELPADARQYLVLALGDHMEQGVLMDLFTTSAHSGERINALRALSRQGRASEELLIPLLDDPYIHLAALELLLEEQEVNSDRLAIAAENAPVVRSKILLLGKAAMHADSIQRKTFIERARSLDNGTDPYLHAALIQARAMAGDLQLQALLAIMRSNVSATERSAAFASAIAHARGTMARSRYASLEAQYAVLSDIIKQAIETSDPGLICAATEVALGEGEEVMALLIPPELEASARQGLRPVEDLEAILLLDRMAAERDARAVPLPVPGKTRSSSISIGTLERIATRKYKISTSRGDIEIVLDPYHAPFTCVAFDSLVSAGYYDGRTFHRIVPNFVSQGGCPRGDGYGGAAWTISTEISSKPFLEGSVGMASAGPDTENVQFFITHSATPHLDGRYTRFGEVTQGLDIVRQLQIGDAMHVSKL